LRWQTGFVPLNFVAIDFETANGSPASPCAVGLVRVQDGQIVESAATLIQPPYPNNWFHEGNIRVHGIRPSDVDGAPEMHEALAFIVAFVGDYPLVAHNAPFDMGVLRKSAELIEWPLPQINYTCSLAISRKTYNIESYRLNAVAYAIGHEEFNHHDALADSDACARIIIHAAKRHGAENMDELLTATKQVWKKLVTET
jgi:DNA polymerase-3 subunit epsilon